MGLLSFGETLRHQVTKRFALGICWVSNKWTTWARLCMSRCKIYLPYYIAFILMRIYTYVGVWKCGCMCRCLCFAWMYMHIHTCVCMISNVASFTVANRRYCATCRSEWKLLFRCMWWWNHLAELSSYRSCCMQVTSAHSYQEVIMNKHLSQVPEIQAILNFIPV